MNLYELIKTNYLSRFDIDAAKNQNFSLMFVDEENNQSVTVVVKDGEIEFKEKENLNIDLRIISTLEVFNKIMNGDTTGVDLYMEGELELEGDRSMLEMQFEVFGIV